MKYKILIIDDEELIIDYNSRTVFYGKEQLDFSNKEFEIIRFLSQNAGMVFDRETIYEKLWGYNGEGDSIVVKEHIRKIRNKLSVYTDKNDIETVWGVGYKWANKNKVAQNIYGNYFFNYDMCDCHVIVYHYLCGKPSAA